MLPSILPYIVFTRWSSVYVLVISTHWLCIACINGKVSGLLLLANILVLDIFYIINHIFLQPFIFNMLNISYS